MRIGTASLTSLTATHALIIDRGWFDRMWSATLYLYEFETEDFVLQDEITRYYVSTRRQIPKQKHVLDDLFAELLSRNVEVRITDRLWEIAQVVQYSTLHWSLCRVKNAQK